MFLSVKLNFSKYLMPLTIFILTSILLLPSPLKFIVAGSTIMFLKDTIWIKRAFLGSTLDRKKLLWQQGGITCLTAGWCLFCAF